MRAIAVAWGLAALLCGAGAARADEGALTMRTVDEVVERYDRAIQSCGRGVARGGDTVVMMVALTVDGEGHVADAAAQARSRAGSCLEKVARKMLFPPTGMTSHLALPFMLTSRR